MASPKRVQVSRAGRFSVGTIVTRDGSDRHRITAVNADGDLITVVCLVAPESGWCEVGEIESNCAHRYQHASLDPEER